MGYRAIPFRNFGAGLDLRSQPDSLNESHALDVLNCEFTATGAVKQRDGYAKFTGSVLTNQPDSMHPFYKTDGTRQLMVGNGNRLDALNTSGTSAANSTAPTANPHFFVRFGGPTGELMFIANGTDTVRSYDGSSFSTAGYTGTTPTGKFLCVQSGENRLVNARRGGSTAGDNPSSVRFSDAGVPKTWGANNYVDLDPGDGEAIMGICTWNQLVFVFKETKFFIFYGNSADSSGNPVFNYRAIRSGCGLAASQALVSARDGVYFLDRKGVYKTTGGPPQQLSGIVDPFFLGNPNIYFKSSAINQASISVASMAFFEERIYLSVPTGSASTNNRTLVFDPRYQWWSLYDWTASAMTPFRIGTGKDELALAYTSALTKDVARYNPGSYTADNMTTTGTGGTAITSRWRSGWFDYGDDSVKRIRESKVWGSGTVKVDLFHDFKDAGSASQTLALGPSPALWPDGTSGEVWATGDDSTDLWGPSGTISPKSMRKAVRGTTFSTQFSNSTLNTSWGVNRLHHHLADQKIESTVAA